MVLCLSFVKSEDLLGHRIQSFVSKGRFINYNAANDDGKMGRNLVSQLIFGVFVSLCVLNLCTGLGTFGDSCNRRKECNATAGLRCLKGSCQCQNPDGQAFSEKFGACAVKIGRRCGPDDEPEANNSTTIIVNDHENSTQDDLNKSNNSTTTSITPDSICVENAECRKLKLRKWCRCKDGFSPNSGGSQCVPVAKYGESCSLNEPCEKRSGTECRDGRCVCPFGDQQYFDSQERRCISYANGNCTLPKVSPCVGNAECVNVQLRTGYISDDGVKKIHSKSVTQCHCVKGFAETKGGYCMGMAGTGCGLKQPCNAEGFLVCSDGQCKCRNPLHEMVDENSGQCVSLVGSSCPSEKSEVKGLPCVENSECVANFCVCKKGFATTTKKTCLKSYKENCEPNQCNANGGLACINGICECFDSHLVFDETAKACVGLSTTSGSEGV